MTPSVRNLCSHSVGMGTAAILLAGIAVLLAGGTSPTRADSDCTAAFERWSKVSSTRTRKQNAATGAPEACLASEAARADLLQALAKTRGLCEGAPWLDQSAKQTLEMIDINASVIGSVPLCRSEEVPAKTVEPDPAPARPAARPRACLEVTQAAPERFVLSNRKCAGRSVLAVIERKDAAGKIACKAYSISRQLAVATPARPEINYQCILDEGNCTKAHVATFFPECDW
jgi:hypothetical protein